MKKVFTFTLLYVITFPFHTFALTGEATTTSDYTSCKEQALSKREKSLIPARKEYLYASSAITNDTKKQLDSIKWHTNSLYKKEASAIEIERSRKISLVSEKMKRARVSAQATWSAEDSLCEFNLKNKEVSAKKLKNSK